MSDLTKKHRAEAHLKGLTVHYRGNDPRPRIVFELDDDGHPAAYVTFGIQSPKLSALGVDIGDVPGFKPDTGADAMVEKLFTDTVSAVAQWVEQMRHTCPLCGGPLSQPPVVLVTTQNNRPQVQCSGCGWRPTVPLLIPKEGEPT